MGVFIFCFLLSLAKKQQDIDMQGKQSPGNANS
jgi:hypothetical protein